MRDHVRKGRPPREGEGRPTKLNDEMQKKITDAMRAGAYIETAAFYSGISKASLYSWLRKGNSGECERCVAFLNAVNLAMAESELKDIDNIRKASETDWRASAWRLERKFPQKWGHKAQISATSELKDADDSINDIISEEIEKLESDRFDD